jgi:hypothetical protein
LLMYASCGWFFDDVAGIESALVIRQAAYVLDLWQRFGGRPPTKDVLVRLNEARSNLPQAGTGADVFRRVAGHRTTSREIAAAVAFSEVARAGSSPGKGGAPHLPGFTVTASGSDKKARDKGPQAVSGRLTVEHQRTGEVETVKYEARTKGVLGLVGKVGDERMTLDELPDELRDPVAFALIERLSVSPKVLASDCRQAIELGRLSAGAGSHVDPMFHGLLSTLVVRLLQDQAADAANEETLSVLLELLEALPEPARFEPQRRVQEWLWSGFENLAPRARPPSAVLRALAEKVGLTLRKG